MIGPRELAALIPDRLGCLPDDLPAAPFHAIVVDSREAASGDLFVALKGERTDGHAFVAAAVAAGATAVLAERLPDGLPSAVQKFVVDDSLTALQQAGRAWRRQQTARVIGITGSVGKTTTREAIAQVLGELGPTWESPRNYNSEIGLPIALLGIEPSHAYAVVELGPYDQREMDLICGIAASDIGVVTNVGPTHLERFGTLDDTERIKGTLPASLRADGLAVLNADDERVRRMRGRTPARVVSYGFAEDADVRAADVRSRGLDGIAFTLHARGATVAVETPLIGTHQARTALAAAAVGLEAGMALDAVAATLGRLRPGSRLRTLRGFAGSLIIDDTYNAAPLSMQAALDLLAELPGTRIAVLGDMLELGSEEAAAHAAVGAYAASRCDRLIAIGRRARGIADGAWEAGHAQVQWFEEKEPAAEHLRAQAGVDDVILVKASHGAALETLVERLVTP